ncbi:E3 ubiquitin-protein ligase TRIM39-like isoform X2 [Eleginops maclovinus]|uniref:E3 ubiquitin-protein ligase TRIM39-like isoform X2 n=1 Tax=Eleginops maclovinus TaxID=56733 RepID=UPI003080D0BE
MTQINANMAYTVPLEEQFKCCICLDIYIDPVSIPCGHNFCLDCIEEFWDTKDTPDCPLCKETFSTRPQLSINRGYAEIIKTLQRSQKEDEDTMVPHGSTDQSLNTLSEAGEIPCDICQKDKSPSVKSCNTCQVSYCEVHFAPHLRDPVLQRHRLKDPTLFASSHLCRHHKQPLTKFCSTDQAPVCGKCMEKGHKHHQTVCMEREQKRVKTCLRDTKSSIKQMICGRLRKKEEIKQSADLSKKITEREIQSSAQVCSKMIAAIERHQADLVEELEEKQQEVERRAEELIGELTTEIGTLQARAKELHRLLRYQNPLYLLQSFPSASRLPTTREWSEVAVHSDNCMETVTRAVSQLMNVCQELVKKLSAEEAEKMNQYAVDVTLDPETASGWLILSPDNKKVCVSSQMKNTPDNPQRFNSCVCVLGKQSFTSGRRYWVVQVGDKSEWDLGLARESINRKGAITVRPNNGYWAICRRKGNKFSACAGPSVPLHLRETLRKVGVFLDYDEGLVSFYDTDAKTHIYTYSKCDFTEPLYPYFNPCLQDDGKNTSPLIICPVERRVRGEQDITIESAL